MKMFAKILIVLLGFVATANAQITVPNTFVTGTPILASAMNANFDTLESGALNRTGGTITGNISVDSAVTVDGIDIGAVLGGTGTPTFATITTTGNATIGGVLAVTGTTTLSGTATTHSLVGAASATYDVGSSGTRYQNGWFSGGVTAGQLIATSTSNDSIDTSGGINAGTGNVGIVDSTGKIPAISTTYFASVSGTNLTGVAMLDTANTFTAKNNFLTYTETKVAITPSASMTVDLSLGSHFTLSNTTTGTMTFSNPATSGLAGAFTLAITGNGTSHPITWPGSVLWPGAVAPTLTTTNAKTDFITFVTYDGGTTWYGFVGGQNF